MDTNMPFPTTPQEPTDSLTQEQILADADQILMDFAYDYQKMSK